jgi:hypothetical protein
MDMDGPCHIFEHGAHLHQCRELTRELRTVTADRLNAENPVIRLARQNPHEPAAPERVAQPVTVLTFALRNQPPTPRPLIIPTNPYRHEGQPY